MGETTVEIASSKEVTFSKNSDVSSSTPGSNAKMKAFVHGRKAVDSGK